MAQRINFNQRSNEELARLLYQSPAPVKPAPADKPSLPAPVEPAPEPLASRRVSELGPQTWPLSERTQELGPLSEREERALFAALSKGTRANLGREPTVPELVQLLQRVNDARAFISTVEQVLRGNDGIYLDNGRIIFGGSAQRRRQRGEQRAQAA
jgi:hypothetical protein